jgi:hypothetical protein
MTTRGWKTQIRSRCQSILHSAPLGSPLREEDDCYLREILPHHPDAAEKIGAGIAHIEVRANGWGGRTFWIVRADGTETDFSFESCLTPPTPFQELYRACRTAVVPSILAAKNAIFDTTPTVTCPVTGEQITRETAHLDHANPWPFDAIVAAFIKSLVEPTRDGDLETRFRDPAFAERFRHFHDERASLRAVSRWANLSVLKRRSS